MLRDSRQMFGVERVCHASVAASAVDCDSLKQSSGHHPAPSALSTPLQHMPRNQWPPVSTPPARGAVGRFAGAEYQPLAVAALPSATSYYHQQRRLQSRLPGARAAAHWTPPSTGNPLSVSKSSHLVQTPPTTECNHISPYLPHYQERSSQKGDDSDCQSLRSNGRGVIIGSQSAPSSDHVRGSHLAARSEGCSPTAASDLSGVSRSSVRGAKDFPAAGPCVRANPSVWTGVGSSSAVPHIEIAPYQGLVTSTIGFGVASPAVGFAPVVVVGSGTVSSVGSAAVTVSSAVPRASSGSFTVSTRSSRDRGRSSAKAGSTVGARPLHVGYPAEHCVLVQCAVDSAGESELAMTSSGASCSGGRSLLSSQQQLLDLSPSTSAAVLDLSVGSRRRTISSAVQAGQQTRPSSVTPRLPPPSTPPTRLPRCESLPPLMHPDDEHYSNFYPSTSLLHGKQFPPVLPSNKGLASASTVVSRSDSGSVGAVALSSSSSVSDRTSPRDSAPSDSCGLTCSKSPAPSKASELTFASSSGVSSDWRSSFSSELSPASEKCVATASVIHSFGKYSPGVANLEPAGDGGLCNGKRRLTANCDSDGNISVKSARRYRGEEPRSSAALRSRDSEDSLQELLLQELQRVESSSPHDLARLFPNMSAAMPTSAPKTSFSAPCSTPETALSAISSTPGAAMSSTPSIIGSSVSATSSDSGPSPSPASSNPGPHLFSNPSIPRPSISAISSTPDPPLSATSFTPGISLSAVSSTPRTSLTHTSSNTGTSMPSTPATAGPSLYATSFTPGTPLSATYSSSDTALSSTSSTLGTTVHSTSFAPISGTGSYLTLAQQFILKNQMATYLEQIGRSSCSAQRSVGGRLVSPDTGPVQWSAGGCRVSSDTTPVQLSVGGCRVSPDAAPVQWSVGGCRVPPDTAPVQRSVGECRLPPDIAPVQRSVGGCRVSPDTGLVQWAVGGCCVSPPYLEGDVRSNTSAPSSVLSRAEGSRLALSTFRSDAAGCSLSGAGSLSPPAVTCSSVVSCSRIEAPVSVSVSAYVSPAGRSSVLCHAENDWTYVCRALAGAVTSEMARSKHTRFLAPNTATPLSPREFVSVSPHRPDAATQRVSEHHRPGAATVSEEHAARSSHPSDAATQRVSEQQAASDAAVEDTAVEKTDSSRTEQCDSASREASLMSIKIEQCDLEGVPGVSTDSGIVKEAVKAGLFVTASAESGVCVKVERDLEAGVLQDAVPSVSSDRVRKPFRRRHRRSGLVLLQQDARATLRRAPPLSSRPRLLRDRRAGQLSSPRSCISSRPRPASPRCPRVRQAVDQQEGRKVQPEEVSTSPTVDGRGSPLTLPSMLTPVCCDKHAPSNDSILQHYSADYSTVLERVSAVTSQQNSVSRWLRPHAAVSTNTRSQVSSAVLRWKVARCRVPPALAAGSSPLQLKQQRISPQKSPRCSPLTGSCSESGMCGVCRECERASSRSPVDSICERILLGGAEQQRPTSGQQRLVLSTVWSSQDGAGAHCRLAVIERLVLRSARRSLETRCGSSDPRPLVRALVSRYSQLRTVPSGGQVERCSSQPVFTSSSSELLSTPESSPEHLAELPFRPASLRRYKLETEQGEQQQSPPPAPLTDHSLITTVFGSDALSPARTSALSGETFSSTPVMPRPLSRIRRRRCRFKSGLDYMIKRKRKRVLPASASSADLPPACLAISKRCVSERAIQGSPLSDLSAEIRSWMLNRSAGETNLQRAAKLGHPEAVLFLLESSEHALSCDHAGFTPLHEACARGHVTVARLLLLYGADCNSSARGGVRPIHEAVEQGSVEMVRLLLSYGADPCVPTYSGMSPVQLSVDAGTDEVCQLLQDHLRDLDPHAQTVQPWLLPPASFMEEPGSQLRVLDTTSLHMSPDTSSRTPLVFHLSSRPLPPLFCLRDARGASCGDVRYVALESLARYMGAVGGAELLRVRPDLTPLLCQPPMQLMVSASLGAVIPEAEGGDSRSWLRVNQEVLAMMAGERFTVTP